MRSHKHALIMHKTNVLNLRSTNTRCPRILPHLPYFLFLSLFLHFSPFLSCISFENFKPTISKILNPLNTTSHGVTRNHFDLSKYNRVNWISLKQWISENGSHVTCHCVENCAKMLKFEAISLNCKLTNGLIDMCDGVHMSYTSTKNWIQNQQESEYILIENLWYFVAHFWTHFDIFTFY